MMETKILGSILTVGGLALAAAGIYLSRKADIPPYDFHGNSMNDPRGLKKLGSLALLVIGLILGIMLGPMMLMVG